MMTTRFAPSPTGLLHLGHAYAALFAYEQAQAHGGRFLLRIEDIDKGRCRVEFEQAIFEDLAWLDIPWLQPVRRQSKHLKAYRRALDRLTARGLTYPCFCTRRDIAAEIARAGGAPQGPDEIDGPVYPGICRGLDPEIAATRIAAGETPAIRLNLARAQLALGFTPLTFEDVEAGTVAVQADRFGDVVLARKDFGTSYHMAVVVDDAAQGITLVTRGLDLLPATHIHRLLQALLDLPVPRWHHHRLVTDAAGKRLAKRDHATALAELRAQGVTPSEVRQRLGFAP